MHGPKNSNWCRSASDPFKTRNERFNVYASGVSCAFTLLQCRQKLPSSPSPQNPVCKQNQQSRSNHSLDGTLSDLLLLTPPLYPFSISLSLPLPLVLSLPLPLPLPRSPALSPPPLSLPLSAARVWQTGPTPPPSPESRPTGAVARTRGDCWRGPARANAGGCSLPV
jgi:hypothetical protein